MVGGDGDYFRSVEQWRLYAILTKNKNAIYGRFCGCRSVKLTAKTQIKWSSALKQFKVPKSVKGVLTKCCVYALIDLCNTNFPDATRVFCLSQHFVYLVSLYNAGACHTPAPPGNASSIIVWTILV